MKLLMVFLPLTLLLLTACSHQMDHGMQITSEEMFLAEMVPHHQEAVDTSQVMLNSDSSDVRQLAASIVVTQRQEIQLMKSWENDWYPSSNYTPMYVNMMPDLNAYEGVDRDIAYLQGMKHHHQMAIAMAKQAQQLQLHPEVRALTENIIKTQQKEVDTIDELLALLPQHTGHADAPHD